MAGPGWSLLKPFGAPGLPVKGKGQLTQVIETVRVGARLIRLLHKLEVMGGLADDEAR